MEDFAQRLEAFHQAEEKRQEEAAKRYEQGKAAKVLRASVEATLVIAANTRCDVQGGYAESCKFSSVLQAMLKQLDQFEEG